MVKFEEYLLVFQVQDFPSFTCDKQSCSFVLIESFSKKLIPNSPIHFVCRGMGRRDNQISVKFIKIPMYRMLNELYWVNLAKLPEHQRVSTMRMVTSGLWVPTSLSLCLQTPLTNQ
ncbi:uncharacterized protein A4U43_C08F34650 [Asparagus officinalis]|nr:uncharacterized protein A4U43_C08F34650 [Asparagus officinalis]